MNFAASRPTISALDCQTSLVSRLSKDRVGDPRPVRQAMENGVRHDRLPNDERGQNVKVDSVDTPVDEHVADYTEKNQQVHTTIKQFGGSRRSGKRPNAAAVSAQ